VGAGQTGQRPQLLVTLALLGLVSALYPVAGALIVSRIPRHVVGWLLVWAGLAMSIVSFMGAYGLAGPDDSPAAQLAAWLASWVFVPALTLSAVLLLLLFPTGAPPSRQWRPLVLVVVVLAAATAIGYAFRPGQLALGGSVQNPFGLTTGGAAWEFLARAGDVLFPFILIAAMGSMVVRYRDAGPDERQQLKWFAYAAAVLVVGVGIASLPLPSFALVGWFVAAVALAAMPITVAIAIFKYRLYDIDLIISETLIYVGLVAILGGLFTGSIAFFQRLFVAVTGDTSDAAIVITALIIAGVLTPIRKALEAAAERRFKPRAASDEASRGADVPAPIEQRLVDIETRLTALEAGRPGSRRRTPRPHTKS
jgi:MFS family permease